MQFVSKFNALKFGQFSFHISSKSTFSYTRLYSAAAGSLTETANQALRQRLKEDLKSAMRSSLKTETSVIRSLISDISYADKTPNGAPDSLYEIVKRSVNRRNDAIEQFEIAGRQDLAQKEKEELAILLKYMPMQMAAEEMEMLVKSVAEEIGATSGKELGKVVKAVKEKVDAASLDMKELAIIARRILK